MGDKTMTLRRVLVKDLNITDPLMLENCKICGWINSIQSNLVGIRDYTGLITVINNTEKQLNIGDAIEVKVEVLNHTLHLKEVIEHNRFLAKKKNSYIKFRDHEFQEILKFTNKVEQSVRSFLFNQDFIEINTPVLWNSIKEYGQLELAVIHPEFRKSMHSLVQSPLGPSLISAIGGLEKTFQFAKCFRWEAEELTPYRSLEFRQLHLTMAFTSLEEGRKLVESLIKHLFKELKYPEPKFYHLSYEQSYKYYGTDNPDTRFKEILTPIIPTEFGLSKDYKCLVIKDSVSEQMVNKVKPVLEKFFSEAYIIKNESKKATDIKIKWINELTNNSWNLFFLIKVDSQEKKCLFEKFRQILFKKLYGACIDYECVWIDEYPYLFSEEEKGTEFAFKKHESRGLFSKTYLKENGELYSYSHDLVINGIEIASGGLKENEVEKFKMNLVKSNVYKYTKGCEYNYHIEALKQGAPKLYTLAIGLERLLALLLKKSSIQEVMLFPKDGEGKCDIITPSLAKNQ
ncbi:amino acid--tRNA ligase-related protein [Heyndrickxia coagulans]|uniref:amino acid--tRNA ligase-related protein n=1 Tax=Heyndrickxia coagulans TaxID=1398 RepID=UPI001A952BBE|nr:amino acid--tRNA ligase-related protein [Heyndrickxia coagulans]